MRPRLLHSLTFAKAFLLANGILWIMFFILFAFKGHPYKPHRPSFEEELPGYSYFGRALPIENEYMGPFLRTSRFVQGPSFYAGRPYFWYFNSHGITVDRLYGGVSVGGYYLLVVCLLSFLQWYLVGLLIDYVRKRINTRPTRASGNPGHAYDAQQ